MNNNKITRHSFYSFFETNLIIWTYADTLYTINTPWPGSRGFVTTLNLVVDPQKVLRNLKNKLMGPCLVPKFAFWLHLAIPI